MKRGSLKIFLGYAAGVGKTYAMLEAAHALKQNGHDVVAGYIEPHQRPETSAQIKNLEIIEPQSVYRQNVALQEFNLEAALERHPEYILIDELAHTNAPGVRHHKRYQDIEELLHNGINVYTTVNIQHIESLNDVVEVITGVVVNERVPDRIFDEAETIALIDIAPRDLIDRLHAGKIYKTEQAKRALDNFFTEENLVALREIALRKAADQINQNSYKTSPYFTKEHILVCLSASPTNEKVIRTAARMADAFHATFTAVYVDDESDEMDDVSRQQLKVNIRLAEELNAQVSLLYGDDIALQLSEYAKISNVSKIVIGRSIRKRSLFKGQSIIDQMSEFAPMIDIYVIPDQASSYYHRRSSIIQKEYFQWKDGFVAFGIIALATAVGAIFAEQGFSESNIIVVYLLGVLFISILTRGRIWSSLASVVSVLVFNYFFTQPQFSLQAYDTGYPFTFLFMFIAAFVTSTLTTKLKQKDIQSAKKAYRTDILLETSLRLQSASNRSEIIDALGHQVKKLLNTPVIIYTLEADQLIPTVYSDLSSDYIHDVLLTQQERAIAQWVFENNKRAGAHTNTLSNAKLTYLAIRSVDKVVAVLGFANHEDGMDPFEKNLLVSLINEGGLALEKASLDEDQHQNALLIEQEKLRSTILRTISHDLRTPLTTILGNMDLLQQASLDTVKTHEIYEDVRNDALWLIDLVENILAMTKIDQDHVMLHMEGEILEDLVDESVQRVRTKAKNHRIEVVNSDILATVNVDSKLMIQVFTNILDNALKYTPKGTLIKITTEIVDREWVTVHFEDQGPGITDKSKIFEMFYTQDQDSRRGLGLGLFLVYEIVKAHKGRISVEDVFPHGACFSIMLRRYDVDETTAINH